MRVLKIVLAMLTVLYSSLGLAAVPQIPRFRLVDAAAGLPSSQINAMVQDRAGYLWLATADGLARYDGTGFRVWRHDPADPRSLAGNTLNSLYVDEQDRIWVGTDSAGISVLDADRSGFVHFNHANHPQMSNDGALVITGRGKEIWFGNYGGGLHRIDADGRISRYDLSRIDDPLPPTHVAALAEDGDGRMWVGTPDGLVWFDGERLHRERLPEPAVGVSSLIWAGGMLWVGTPRGIYRRGADGRWRAPRWAPMFVDGNMLWSVVDAGDGEFWLGTERGLWRTRGNLPPVPIKVLDADAPQMGSRDVLTLLRGDQGGLWVPVDGRGLAYLREDWKRTAVFRPPHDMGDSVYCSLVPTARSGGLWLIDGEGRLLRFDTGSGEATITGLQHEDLSTIHVTASLEDRRGRLWLGSYQAGLARIDLRTGAYRSWPRSGPDPRPEYAPDNLVEAGDGSIWLTALGALQHRDGESGKLLDQFFTDHDTSAHGIGRLGVDPEGGVWAIGGDSVLTWQPRSRRFEPVPDLQGARVYSFAFDGPRHLWLHRLSGLERWRRDGAHWVRERHVGAEQGLPLVESNGLQIDPAGRAWLATRRGLWRIDVTRGTSQLRKFGLRDGLTSQEFVEGCLLMAENGVLIGGTADGYVMLLDTVMPDVSPFSPDLTIEEASVLRDGRRLALDDGGFALRAEDRQLRIVTRLLSFGDPSANRYRSWLHGLDAGWVEQGTSGLREFSALPDGNYALDVQGIDPAGNASRVRTLRFSMAPPWWRSGWGLALLLILVTLLVWGLAELYRRRLRERSERQLEQLKRELAERASESKSRFLATLGHEVRTPMTGVLGMTELLLSTPLDPRQHDYAAAIQGAGKHLLRLVNDALDLARIEAGKLPLEVSDFDLRAMLVQVCALVRPMAENKGLRFEFRGAPDLPRALQGDSNRVQQILLNLLINGIKFTERGCVVLQVARSPNGAIGSGIWFEVSDTGPGMSPEQCERLFRRFEQAEGARTAARYGGSGLGLAICRELATAMGGRIEVASVLGQGAHFQVELPLRWAEAAAVPPSTSVSPRASTRSLRLLLVEDDPTIAEVVGGLLRARGHEVVHAPHGLAALTEVASDTFDAGFCDLDLPGLDGLALVRQLRAMRHGLPLVAITARSDSGAEPEALNAGFDGFLRKPLTGDMLEDALASVLERRRD